MRFSAFAVIAILIASCAQVVAPGGGKKDTTPPHVLKYSPDSASIHFNSNHIELTFDEYVQLKDLNNQLIISPPLKKTPDIDVKNKTLTIDLDKEEQLKPNTTYCISLGNALQDVNEGNAIENFKYIFSTGNFIDSLKVKGKVQTAFDHRTEKGILVMLYADSNDSAVYNSQPDYFTKTAVDGTFEINNIKDGNYKIVAIKDGNGNFKYDGDNEAIAFYDSIINPSERKFIGMELFQEPAKKVFLKKYNHPSYGKFIFVFNQGSDSIHIQNMNNSQKGVQEYLDFSKNKDTLTYWITNYQNDSIRFQLTNGNKIIDTVEFKFINKEEALRSKKNPLKLSVISSPNGNQSFDLNKNILLSFNNRLNPFINNTSIEVKEDTLQKKGVCLAYITSGNVLQIKNCDSTTIVKKENTKYHLFIPPNTIQDIFGLTNDTIKIDLKTREAKYYGSLKLNITIPGAKQNYIVQLLDENENIVQENSIKISKTLDLEYLHPKKYKLKIILDTNSNGKWDTGNYLKHQQAEKVIYNSELINVRSNWDMELDWNVQ